MSVSLEDFTESRRSALDARASLWEAAESLTEIPPRFPEADEEALDTIAMIDDVIKSVNSIIGRLVPDPKTWGDDE